MQESFLFGEKRIPERADRTVPHFQPRPHPAASVDRADERKERSFVFEALRQVNQSAALRVNRRPIRAARAEFRQESGIRAQPAGVTFGKAAAKENSVGSFGKASVAKRAEFDKNRPSAFERIQVIAIVETEGLVAGDGDPDRRFPSILAGVFCENERLQIGRASCRERV